jgi:hypothetical protein
MILVNKLLKIEIGGLTLRERLEDIYCEKGMAVREFAQAVREIENKRNQAAYEAGEKKGGRK